MTEELDYRDAFKIWVEIDILDAGEYRNSLNEILAQNAILSVWRDMP